MTEKKTYDSDQIKDAKKLADVLISVKGESRPVFALMVESMLIGIGCGQLYRIIAPPLPPLCQSKRTGQELPFKSVRGCEKVPL